MSNTKTVGQELQDEVLKAVQRSQDAVVEAIEVWAGALQAIKPPLPELSVPLAGKVPTPQELVAGAYDFAGQLLASQRTFAEGVLSATAPLFTGDVTPAARKNGGSAK